MPPKADVVLVYGAVDVKADLLNKPPPYGALVVPDVLLFCPKSDGYGYY